MATLVDSQSSFSSIPGSYFAIERGHPSDQRMTHDSLFRPPAQSPRPFGSRASSYTRSRSYKSNSSIPRPVSRSEKDAGCLRKRPRLDAQSSSYSFISTPTTPSSTSHLQSRPPLQIHGSFGLDGESDYDLSYTNEPDSAHSRDPASPPPLVNTTYRLAGGLDTPNAVYERRLDEWGEHQEQLDWRFNRFAQEDSSRSTKTIDPFSSIVSICDRTQESRSNRPVTPRTPSSTSGYGQKRALEDSPIFETPAETNAPPGYGYTASGWHIRSRAWAITGGLAVKAINFCWNTAFRGFSAGDGQSYALDIGTPEVPVKGFRVSQVASTEDVFSNDYEKQDDIPGRFPEDDLTEDHMHTRQYDSTHWMNTTTPTAQGQSFDPMSEIRGDWTMIDMPMGVDGTVRRRKSRASIAGSRNGSYRGTHNSKTSAETTTGASFASPRARARAASGSSGSYNKRASTNNHSPAVCSPERPHLQKRQSYTGSTLHRRQSSQSLNLQMSPSNTQTVRNQSSLSNPSALVSPDIVKYEKRMRKKAKAEDESMARMNAHLQDLIRQGKEALGSKVCIEDDTNDDEGFYEDDTNDEDDQYYGRRRHHHSTTGMGNTGRW